jgi:hypothetical protein
MLAIGRGNPQAEADILTAGLRSNSLVLDSSDECALRILFAATAR